MNKPSSVDAIFRVAFSIESDAIRDEYMKQACGDDQALHDRVVALLHAHHEEPDYLNVPPTGVAATMDLEPVAERPGNKIGPYKLIEEIGEGGMGLVYMARQREPVKRRVALKIIKPGMDTRQVIARFEAERQALAMMDHPNIAKVLDAGATESGRPYFVMELVNGLPVTKYCDEQHLTPKERLELFVPICQAVQHAHQKGIIHRDLKPSNILVAMYDNHAVPKIIDFGVAKATSQTLTERTMFTQLGQVVGTLEYMSPEQAERNQLDIDTRSDIYSLGVVLYELLAGETPFDRMRLRSAAFDEMLRIIREEEPSKPSTKVSSSQSLPSIAANRRIEPAKLGKMIRGELDWIVLKAMEKDRGRRYETASKFAEDVEHYLNDEPVLACPPSRWYLVRKFARKNRATAATIAMVVIVLFAVAASGFVLLGQATRTANRRIEVNLQINDALAELERSTNDNEQSWDLAVEAAGRAKTLAESNLADPSLADRVKVLTRKLDQERGDQQVIVDLENIRLMPADKALREDSFEQVLAEYDNWFSNEQLNPLEVSPDEITVWLRSHGPEVRPALVGAMDNWLHFIGKEQKEKPSARLKELAASLSVMINTTDNDPWRKRIRDAGESRDLDTLVELAESIDVSKQPPTTTCMLGGQLRKDPNGVEAAISLLQRAQRHFPDDLWCNFGLANAFFEAQPPRYDEAVRYFTAAVALRPRSTAARSNLGLALQRLGRTGESVAQFRQAIEFDPNDPITYVQLGSALRSQGELALAIGEYRRAIELKPDYAWAHIDLGCTLFDQALELSDQGRFQEAEEQALYAITLQPDNYYAHTNLGRVYMRKGELERAISEYRLAIKLKPDAPDAHSNLGIALQRQGNLTAAMDEHQQAVKVAPDNPDALSALGGAFFDAGNDDEAVKAYRRAIELKPNYAEAHSDMGRVLRRQGKVDAALDAYRRAIELKPDIAVPHKNLGNLLSQIGKTEDAIKEYRVAIRLAPNSAAAHLALGRTLSKHGEGEEGVAELRRSVELQPSGDSYNSLAVGLIRLGRVDEAIVEYRRAVKLGDPKAHFNLAQHLMDDQDRLDEAVELLRGGLEAMPDFVEARNWLGNCLIRQDKLPEGLAEFQQACKLKPDFAQAHYNAARTLWYLDRRQEAVEELGRVFGPGPDGRLPVVFAASLRTTALRLALSNDGKSVERELAVALGNELTRVFPENKDAWYAYGVALFQSEDWEKAIASFVKCKQSASTEFFLAMSQYQLGNKSEARKYYQQALARNKDIDKASPEDVRELQAKAAALIQDGQNEP